MFKLVISLGRLNSQWIRIFIIFGVIFLLQAALEVTLVTFSTASVENFIKMTFQFQCIYDIFPARIVKSQLHTVQVNVELHN